MDANEWTAKLEAVKNDYINAVSHYCLANIPNIKTHQATLDRHWIDAMTDNGLAEYL